MSEQLHLALYDFSFSFGKMLGIIVEGPVSLVSLKLAADKALEEDQRTLVALREVEAGGEGFL